MISNKEDDAVIIYHNATFTMNGLQVKAGSIHHQLQQLDLQKNDTVVLYLAAAEDLLPAVWALEARQLAWVLADPLTDRSGADAVAVRYGAQAVITTHLHQQQLPVVPVVFADGPETEAPFAEGEPVCHPCLWKDATAFADEMGKLVGKGQGVALPANMPADQLLPLVLWASANGVPVIINNQEDKSFLKKYLGEKPPFTMEFSLFHFGSYVEDSADGKYELLMDAAAFGDANGFTAIWTPERHFNEFGGLYPNPSVLSAAIAAKTKHIGIRSGSLVSPLHHAVRIAEDWALIDNLSNGRAGISFASGWQCDDFIFFPENYADRHQHMMKQIAAVRELWGGGTVPAVNGLGKEIQVRIFPRPVQQELPMWITVSGKIETFIDAGRIGANILTHLLWQNTEELIDKIAAYRAALQESGFDPRSRKVTVMVHTYLGESDEEVRQLVREPLKSYIRSSTQLIQAMAGSNSGAGNAKEVAGRYGGVNDQLPESLLQELTELAFERFFEQAGLLGSVTKAEKLLHRLKSYDVNEVACLIDFGLGRDDIRKGFAYLNQLRTLYAGGSNTAVPVQTLYCPIAALRMLEDDPELMRYLSTAKYILTEDGDLSDLPAVVAAKVKVMRTAITINGTMQCTLEDYSGGFANKETAFTGQVSDEF
ncbi:LLM class flavin-dependent oxidoreductase [Chitinophaga sp. G-6-1-13]|uniref:LLM class flavin-dependent oxidoreductase n=1 Tax=Chitinophaga fulva TaxID=2728842 RepID=A0A848GPM1_9BACT|nr:MupA/Atu3671 family FMN-dependent luciferase-like monooxygenase [Chitinophaga fulva]NML37858.1 LLM class flavin-dependent oxidoreductase [Chitinophaga fulva]